MSESRRPLAIGWWPSRHTSRPHCRRLSGHAHKTFPSIGRRTPFNTDSCKSLRVRVWHLGENLLKCVRSFFSLCRLAMAAVTLVNRPSRLSSPPMASALYLPRARSPPAKPPVPDFSVLTESEREQLVVVFNLLLVESEKELRFIR